MLNRALQAIDNASCLSAQPWVPGLADGLTGAMWRQFVPSGFVVTNYGTHRWLQNDPKAELRELATLRLGNSLECRVEALPRSTRERYDRCGLVFSEATSIVPQLSAIESALSLIAAVPSLYETVVAYMRALHVLQSPHVDYDVSHSDPEVPFSIFVSVPVVGSERRVRLAESIIHECMHLQLTMIEAARRLVAERDAFTFSPWRRCLRPVGGVFHGLYVFAVIDATFRALGDCQSLTPDEEVFAIKRRTEITEEMRQVRILDVAEGLTSEGRLLLGKLLRHPR